MVAVIYKNLNEITLCVQAISKILDTKYFRRIYCNSEVVLARGFIRSMEATRIAEIK